MYQVLLVCSGTSAFFTTGGLLPLILMSLGLRSSGPPPDVFLGCLGHGVVLYWALLKTNTPYTCLDCCALLRRQQTLLRGSSCSDAGTPHLVPVHFSVCVAVSTHFVTTVCC